MNQEIRGRIFDQLVSVEGYLQGVHKALREKEGYDEGTGSEVKRVGGLLQDVARVRREFEYWFVSPGAFDGPSAYEQEELPF